jgi:YbbR domain-containing protein
MRIISFISERVKKFFGSGDSGKPEETDASEFIGREKAIAFSAALFFSICLWFIVNLSRDFNVTIQVPIQLINLPSDVALSSEIPEYASVNITGEGWKLIPLYSNPPRVNLSADSRQINLFEQMRSQVGAFSDLNVLQVEPIILNIETEEKATKKVPVVSRVQLNLRNQYGAIGSPVISPDSITLTGAQSILAGIEEWETIETELNDVNRSIQRQIPLEAPSAGVLVDISQVEYRVEVAEFTESEVRVPVRTRNLPSGKAVTYNPSSITVRFDVPINKFSEVQGTRPFVAYVDYDDLITDTTGFITPQIETVSSELNVRLRSFHPTSVSYFNIITE